MAERYRVDHIVAGESRYATNALRFDTEAEARADAENRMGRWLLMTGYRVVPESTPEREEIDRG